MRGVLGGERLMTLRISQLTGLMNALDFQSSPTKYIPRTAEIEANWVLVCDEAKLNEVDQKLLWGRQFLNPFSLITL